MAAENAAFTTYHLLFSTLAVPFPAKGVVASAPETALINAGGLPPKRQKEGPPADGWAARGEPRRGIPVFLRAIGMPASAGAESLSMSAVSDGLQGTRVTRCEELATGEWLRVKRYKGRDNVEIARNW
jgi:hypothetical protein